MNNNKLHSSIIIFLIVCIGILSMFCWTFYREQKFFKKIVEQKFDNQENKLDAIYSGLSRDELRLTKLKIVQKIIHKSNEDLKPENVNSMSLTIINEMERYPNLSDPFFVAAWIFQESAFNKNAISPVQARGLMQILPETAQDICEIFHWSYKEGIEFDQEKNIVMGFYYLNKLIEQNHGNIEYGLVSYNAGYYMKNRYILMKKLENGDSLSVDQKMEVGNLTTESKNYPKEIFKRQEEFKKLVLMN